MNWLGCKLSRCPYDKEYGDCNICNNLIEQVPNETIEHTCIKAMINEISEFLPENWTKTILYIEDHSGMYMIKFYVQIDNNYIECYKLNISESKLDNAFEVIHNIVKILKKNDSNNNWSAATISVIKDLFNVDFHYEDNVLLYDFNYKKQWKEKYLI